MVLFYRIFNENFTFYTNLMCNIVVVFCDNKIWKNPILWLGMRAKLLEILDLQNFGDRIQLKPTKTFRVELEIANELSSFILNCIMELISIRKSLVGKNVKRCFFFMCDLTLKALQTKIFEHLSLRFGQCPVFGNISNTKENFFRFWIRISFWRSRYI